MNFIQNLVNFLHGFDNAIFIIGSITIFVAVLKLVKNVRGDDE